MSDPVCFLIPFAHDRELVVTPEYPGYRIALRRRDGVNLRYDGGFNLAASELPELVRALEQLNGDRAA